MSLMIGNCSSSSPNYVNANMIGIAGVEPLLSVSQVRPPDSSTNLLFSIPATYDCLRPLIEIYTYKYQPLAASDQVASILSRSRDAISAGKYKEALSHAQPVYSQLKKSSYVCLVLLTSRNATETDHDICRSSCSTYVFLSPDGCPGFPTP